MTMRFSKAMAIGAFFLCAGHAHADISSAANGGGYYSNKAGFSAGAVYNIPLWRNLYFEPGLSVFYNPFGTTSWDSYEVSVPVISDGQPVMGSDGKPLTETKEIAYQIDGSIRNFGFRVPMLVGYHFDFTEDIKVVRNDKISIEEIKEVNPERIVLSPGPKNPKVSRYSAQAGSNISISSGTSVSACRIRPIMWG